MGAGSNDDMMVTRAAASTPDTGGEAAQTNERHAAGVDLADGAALVDLDEWPAEEAGYGYGV